MSLFKQKFRIESTRLSNWDYSNAAMYFLTICTKNKYPYFGNVFNDTVHLSMLGTVAYNCWLSIPTHFPHAMLDEFIIMPNHVHGIITIDYVETQNFASLHQLYICQKFFSI